MSITHDTEATQFSVEPGYSDDLIRLFEATERAIGGGPPPHDPAAAPRVVLTRPFACARIDRPLDLAAVASDGDRGVARVEFSLDGTPLGTVTRPPYAIRFDPAEKGDRMATLEARAVTDSGVAATAAAPVRLNRAVGACDAAAP